MMRRTCAPILVWFCTFQRKMSPTLMCTRSRSSASILACVPLPLPCTPMITYLRMSSAWHETHATVAGGQPFIGRRRIWPRLPPRPGRNLGRPGEVRAAGIDIDRDRVRLGGIEVPGRDEPGPSVAQRQQERHGLGLEVNAGAVSVSG